MVLFLPGCALQCASGTATDHDLALQSEDFALGQTAFFPGTHLQGQAGPLLASHEGSGTIFSLLCSLLLTLFSLTSSLTFAHFFLSHFCSRVSRSFSDEERERARGARLARPHCALGDAILFDARLLHFGLPNRSVGAARPLLYVNYHRPWFADFQPGAQIIVRHSPTMKS